MMIFSTYIEFVTVIIYGAYEAQQVVGCKTNIAMIGLLLYPWSNPVKCLTAPVVAMLFVLVLLVDRFLFTMPMESIV